MKIITKTVTVGEYTFDVSVDRNIVCDAFEKYPDLMEFLFKNANVNGENEVVVNAIRNKNLAMLLDSTDQIKELVFYALPKMLKKADDFRGTDNASRVDELVKYIEDNEVDTEFSTAMFEFICLGFTPDTNERKPKVKFQMK